jgi:hypothetical protein
MKLGNVSAEACDLGYLLFDLRKGRAHFEAGEASTECVGHFDEPQCVQVCPVACIPVDPNCVEDKATLWQKFRRLQAG